MKSISNNTHNILWIFLLAILTTLTSCEEYNEWETNKLGYNDSLDTYINKVLDKDPILIEHIFNTSRIRYEELQFNITLDEPIPFTQKGEWYFFCYDKDANMIIIQSDFNVAKHKVSDRTINRLKTLYFDIRFNQ